MNGSKGKGKTPKTTPKSSEGWGGRREGAGRRAAGEAPRKATLSVKVSEAELVKARALADGLGVPVGVWAYERIKAALDADADLKGEV